MQTLEIIKIIPDAGGGSLLCNLQREDRLEVFQLPLDSLTYAHLETIIQGYPNCRYRISYEETTISIIHAHWIRRISFSPSSSFFHQVRTLLGDETLQAPAPEPEPRGRPGAGNRPAADDRLEASNLPEPGSRPAAGGPPVQSGQPEADSRPDESGRPPRRYIPGLDGLRGIAVLVVLGYHLGVKQAPGGFLGVTMFLVLSGYLITDLLMSEWSFNRRIRLNMFWIRRARRLLPALAVMLVVVAVWVYVLDSGQFRQMQGDIISTLFFASNWWYIFQNISYFDQFGALTPLRHTWSLGIEEQFYLFWPLLMLLGLKRIRQRWMLALLALAGAAASAWAMSALYEPSYDPSRVYYGTDTRAFSLLIGAALAFVRPSRAASKPPSRQVRIALDAVGFACVLGIFFMVWKTNEYEEFVYPVGMIVLSLMTAVAIAATVSSPSVFARILSWSPLRWAGRRSYGIYIWHYPIIVLTAPVWPAGDHPFVVPLLQTAVCFLIAALSWAWIEEPLLKGGFGRAPFRWKAGAWRIPYGKAGVAVVAGIVLSVSVYFKPPIEFLQVQGMYSGTSSADWVRAGDESALAGTGQGRGGCETDCFQSMDGVSETGGAEAAGPAMAVVHTAQPDGADAGLPSDARAVEADSGRPDAAAVGAGPGISGAGGQTGAPGSSRGGESGAEAGLSGGGNGAPPSEAEAGSVADPTGTAAGEEAETGGSSAPGVTIIGDSVILSVERYLKNKLPDIEVDGKVGRQMHELPDLIQQLQEQDKLRGIVVIELGTNGSFTEKLLSSIIQSLGDDKSIFVINTRVPRPWQDIVNERLLKATETYPHVALIDWYSASEGQDDYFAEDGVHLSAAGATYYADIVYNAIFDQGESSRHVQ